VAAREGGRYVNFNTYKEIDMDIVFAQGGAFVVSSIAMKPVRVSMVPVEKLVRRDLESVIYNRLNRAELAKHAGNLQEAQRLADEAERLFRIATE
jgi:hypothetical protein